MWRPQLGPVDETPYKIDRADIALEDLVAGLRGDLSLLESQFQRATESGTLNPSTEAIYRKKLARTKYQLWSTCRWEMAEGATPRFWMSVCSLNCLQARFWTTH